jgi:hypothetical protein
MQTCTHLLDPLGTSGCISKVLIGLELSWVRVIANKHYGGPQQEDVRNEVVLYGLLQEND